MHICMYVERQYKIHHLGLHNHMYTHSTDSVSHPRHWCSVKLNKFIIEICTNKYMTSYHTLVWTTIIICKRVNGNHKI